MADPKDDKKKDKKDLKKFGEFDPSKFIETNPTLKEAKNKTVVFAFGRMNPPTIGHQKLVDTVNALAKSNKADAKIYLSHTQNNKKDPLDYKTKVGLAKKAFGSIVIPSTSKTIIQVMQELEKNGYTQVIAVFGGDRIAEMKALLNKYNGKDYNFESINIASAGKRDPDSTDPKSSKKKKHVTKVSEMSASAMRELAKENQIDDYEEEMDGKMTKFIGFKNGLPKNLQSQADKIAKSVSSSLAESITEELKVSDGLGAWIDDFQKSDAPQFKNADTKKRRDMAIAAFVAAGGDLDEDLDEALTRQQRMKRSRLMKRIKSKIKRGRERSARRRAPLDVLKKRSQKAARNVLKKRITKGKDYGSMSYGQRQAIDDRINKIPKTRISQIAKRLLPSIKKKEIERMKNRNKKESYILELKAQDKDIKDLPGSQPKGYYKGVDKKDKEARAKQFARQAKMDDDDPRAYKPAPGDKDAKTKPSKHTKKFKDMFGEASMRDLVVRKRPHMMLKAGNQGVKFDGRFKMFKKKPEIPTVEVPDDKQLEENMNIILGEIFQLQEAVEEAVEVYQLDESKEALKKKAEKSGISYGILKKVFDRGVAAWRTGHRPGTTPTQWGLARVNSFATKGKGTWGKADADLAAKVRGESFNESVLHEGVNDPGIFKAVFLAGGPGSGKSFIVGKTAIQPLGFKLINSDPAFEKALKKAGLETTPSDIFSPKGQEARAKAKALTDKQMNIAVEGRLGLVIDGTGKDYDKIEEQVKSLRKIGYEVMMIFVNTDLKTAQERNEKRSRTLPAAVVEKMWNDVQKNIGKFQSLFRNKLLVVDNSNGADYETATRKARAKISKWSETEPKNPAAQKWIEAQKTARGITEADTIIVSEILKTKKHQTDKYILDFVKDYLRKASEKDIQNLGKQIGKKITFDGNNVVIEDGGAGEWGTDELKNKYKKDTPGQ